MKVRIIKNCIDGLTGKALRIGEIHEMDEKHFGYIPKGYAEVMRDAESRVKAENKRVKARNKRG